MNSIDASMFERFPKHAGNAEHGPAQHMDIIFIEGFEGETVIGIDSDELHRPQPVQIDLWAGLPRSLACNTDQICDTIDYGKVHGALQALLAEHGVQLLEALAESIAQMLLVDFGAHWVRVALAKPHKFANVRAVGVTIERRRQQAGSTPRREGAVLALLGAGMFAPEGSL
jgi:dihydroneopterin aldolase